MGVTECRNYYACNTLNSVLGIAVENETKENKMYKRDVQEIINICDNKKSVLPVVTFTLCTIQAGLSTCKAQIEDVNKLGANSRFMWGLKGDGYNYAKQNDAYLWGKMNHIKDTMGLDSVEACVEVVRLFMNVPNLGMVKASFVAQMFGFNVSCIDSHNIKRLGLKPSVVQTPPSKMSEGGKLKKVTAYVEMCQLEGTAYWWDTWCEYVAGNRANRALDTGDVVSRYHVECVDTVKV
tara:strand:+ start:1147 stop:1857 length:711 start_codon:yes stop_codon:yes gene_type:complete